jgi:hypothetical protein
MQPIHLIAPLALLTAGAMPIGQDPKGAAMSETDSTAAAPTPAKEAPSIGEATMDPDGTIILHLRAASPTAVGDALLRYPPDHPQYKSILAHLGGLAPGEHKPVPPFD